MAVKNEKRRSVFACALIVLIFVISFAGLAGYKSLTVSKNSSTPSIGFVGAGSTQGDAIHAMEQNTVGGLEKAGLSVDYVPSSLALNQAKTIDQFLDRNIPILVISPESLPTLGNYLEEAESQGKKVILLDRIPNSVSLRDYTTYIGPNYEQLGSQMVQWLQAHGFSDQTLHDESMVVRSSLDTLTGVDATQGWYSSLLHDRNINTDASVTARTPALGWNPSEAMDSFTANWSAYHHWYHGEPTVIFTTTQSATQIASRFLTQHHIPIVHAANSQQVTPMNTKNHVWLVSLCSQQNCGVTDPLSVPTHVITLPTNYSHVVAQVSQRLLKNLPVHKNIIINSQEQEDRY
ncbi:MAG: substrate-binding domain-containing protein [Aeriscardovia sp.]|nr:substrate-binding domain-containing protein [Aeriscardovia sp.]